MRVLGTTVLAFEWLILALAIPVAINTAGVSPTAAWAVFGVTTILIVLAIGTITRPPGVLIGWAVQVVIVVSGLVVPMLAVLGVIFAGLFYAAIRLARRVDEARAAPADPDAAAVGDTEPVGDGI